MDISMSLKNRYSMNFVSLTLIVKQCLEQELAIVNQFEGTGLHVFILSSRFVEYRVLDPEDP
jgi:hypothetical protein